MKRCLVLFLSCMIIIPSVLEAKLKLVSRSKKKKPEWITILPEEKGYYYLLGVAQNKKDLGEGMGSAVEEGLKQVLTVIGIVVGSKTQIKKQMEKDKQITKMLEDLEKVLTTDNDLLTKGTSAYSLEEMENRFIRKTLADVGWSRTEAAKQLEISLPTLRKKILKYGIEFPEPE